MRVQVSVASVQAQPVPEMAVAVNPVGNVSCTVTVEPSVGPGARHDRAEDGTRCHVVTTLVALPGGELVDLVVRGYPGAFRRFYQRHSQLIYGCIRKRANAADVDDVFQASFERLTAKDYRPLQLWQRGTSLPIYLAKVVRNFVVDFYRAKKSREEAVGGAAEIEALLDPQEETLSLSRAT